MKKIARKHRKQLSSWEESTRRWATATARALALDLCQGRDPAVTPYRVGVVLDPSEKPWAHVIARCSLDQRPVAVGGTQPPLPPFTDWLVTNMRVVGRLTDGTLQGWRWEWIVGFLTDLTPGREYVHLDSDKADYPGRVGWGGPGVAPLAVVAVYHLYGVKALLDHPGLAPLRAGAPPGGVRAETPWRGSISPALLH